MINTDAIRAACAEIDEQTALILDALDTEPEPPEPPEPPSDYVLVPDGGDLQAALDVGGAVFLAESASFGSATLRVPSTLLAGEGGNVLDGGSSPAIIVPPTTHGFAVGQLTPRSTGEVAVLLGRNDAQQTSIEQVPVGVHLQAITSSGHRGKRVIEVNAGDVHIVDADIRDAFDPEGQDSQAICMLNAPGPLTVDGGHLEAASEVFMCGGDAMKIPDCRPTGITLRDVTLTRPLAWRDAGTPKVKNILELKDGHDVLIERCTLSHCWQSAQDGYAFMFTPTRGGSVRNVVVRDCIVSLVAGIVNITGIDDDAATPPPRTQVAIYGGDYRTDPSMPGSGRFCLIGRGPEHFIVEGAYIDHHGSAFIDCSDKSPVDLLRVVGCTWNYGSYGIRIGGANHGDNAAGIVRQIVIEGNTISGAHSQFKSRYPNNTYVESYVESRAHRRSIDWEDRVRRARGAY
jgi:hypothetical protein